MKCKVKWLFLYQLRSLLTWTIQKSAKQARIVTTIIYFKTLIQFDIGLISKSDHIIWLESQIPIMVQKMLAFKYRKNRNKICKVRAYWEDKKTERGKKGLKENERNKNIFICFKVKTLSRRTECIRDLDWTLVKVAIWLFLGYFEAVGAASKIKLSNQV